MISLKILHRGNARAAGRYYSDQKDDYYHADGLAAHWQGKGAEAVGLNGAATPAQFVAAMQGDFGPNIDLARSVRKDAKSRAGIDVTFSAPKSVSIQALVGRDPKVLEAHDHAVAKALEFLERELVHGRQKQDGKSTLEKTGNAIIAKFRHETARPTQFDEADPQLHTHCIVMNATKRADGTWVSVSNEAIFRSKKMLDLVYKAEMAAFLERAGYALRHEGDNFELAHISREQIEHFSKRGMAIESELAKLGKSRKTASHELKQAITLATRQEKRPEISREQLQAGWERDAADLGLDFQATARVLKRDRSLGTENDMSSRGRGGLDRAPMNPAQAMSVSRTVDRVKHLLQPHRIESALVTNSDDAGVRAPQQHEVDVTAAMRARLAKECVDWAIRHFSEREAVMTEQNLIEKALEHSMRTGVEYWGIVNALQDAVKRGHLIKGAPVYRRDEPGNRDPSVLNREGWVKKMIREGATREEAARNVRRAIATGSLVLEGIRYTTQAAREREKRILQIEHEGRNMMESILSREAATAAMAGKGLTPGQLAAAQLILTSKNRVVGVQGLAGVGKSYMLNHVKAAMEEAGYTVKSVAPYSTQVEQLREMKMESVTVASLLSARQNRFTLDAKTVLIIDEAAVVPTRQMEKILQRVEKAGARVVLLGDKDQTKAIEAGRPMHQLQDAQMETALMGDIQRQTNPVLRKAVEIAAPGHAAAALHLLYKKLDAVKEIPNELKRYDTIAKEYAALSPDERDETLIITGTNKSRRLINKMVHQELGLAGKGFEFMLLTRVDTTQAQRRSARYFKVGNIIQPERNYQLGLKQDRQYRVIEVDAVKNRLVVADIATTKTVTFNPARATKISVYDPAKVELSVGDKVRVTRNDPKLDLRNGDRYEVLSVTPTTVCIGTRNATGEIERSVILRGGNTSSLHLDLAYVSTVHASQGLSAKRVLLNQETYTRTTKSDVFYVAISRARERVDIYTNDHTKLPEAVARREDKTAALDIGIAVRQGETRAKAAEAEIKTTDALSL